MISYEPFWKTIKEKNTNSYRLIHKHGVSNSTLTRMRKNLPLSLMTVDDLCNILDCEIEDIVKHVKEESKGEKHE